MSMAQHKHKVVIVGLTVLVLGIGFAARWLGSPKAKAAASEVHQPTEHARQSARSTSR